MPMARLHLGSITTTDSWLLQCDDNLFEPYRDDLASGKDLKTLMSSDYLEVAPVQYVLEDADTPLCEHQFPPEIVEKLVS